MVWEEYLNSEGFNRLIVGKSLQWLKDCFIEHNQLNINLTKILRSFEHLGSGNVSTRISELNTFLEEEKKLKGLIERVENKLAGR